MGQVLERLERLGLALPAPKAPVADYLGTKRSGRQLFVAARVSERRGRVDDEVSPADAKVAARDAMLDLLAIVAVDIGDLDRIASIVFVRGFVHSSASFTGHPQVIDGASELLIELWGDAGRHARTATGAAQLPYGATVQLDMVVELGDG